MKLTENDYFIKDNALCTAKGSQFNTFSTIQLTNTQSDLAQIKALQTAADTARLFAVAFNFALIGTEEAGFDEAFLAALREELKAFDETLTCFVILPTVENANNAAPELLAEVFYHCARRIKDCKAVAGFVLPQTDNFTGETAVIEALKKKHPEYVYFVDEKAQFDKLNQLYPNRIAVKAQ